MVIEFSLADINTVAKKLLESTDGKKVIALHGEMGAGKTTFVHAMGEALSINGTISSPTFSIINQYATANGETVFHIDLYRLKDEEEAIQAGVEDCLYSGNLCLVEWPERCPGIFPDNTLHVKISAIENNRRKIEW